ncbi:hypothetical protein CMI37_30950 [Candidatus Pacearchaeota archaeon]|nr:hypothetical protein [Candidatus Pacearchaeota archaeon]|tara:strand:- start:1126 stop:1779 length:654 start_codon:yes stop_codon:yes gene_type:complete
MTESITEEALRNDKDNQEKRKLEETLTAENEKTDEAKLESMLKDDETSKASLIALLDAKRNANAEAKDLRLKLEGFEKEKDEAEKKKLEEEGEFKALADKEKVEKEEIKATFNSKMIEMKMQIEAVKQGIKNESDISLADMAEVGIDKEFNVSGVEESIAKLKEAKPYLFGADEDDNITPDLTGGNPNLKTKIQKDLTQLSPHERIKMAFGKKRVNK